MEQELIERLEKLEANLLATQHAIRALVLTNARPHIVASAIVDHIEAIDADRAARSSPDAFVAGVAEGRSRVLPTPAQWRGLPKL